MNKNTLSGALFLSAILATSMFAGNAPFKFKMVPGNFLRIKTYTPYDKKSKEWDWQPNDLFRLVKYSKQESCGGNYRQVWLFQAAKPGQTALVFARKQKKHTFRVNILPPIHNPNQSVAREGLFNSNEK